MSTTVLDLREASAEVTLQGRVGLVHFWGGNCCTSLKRKIRGCFWFLGNLNDLLSVGRDWIETVFSDMEDTSLKKFFFLLKEPRERGGQQHSVTSQSHLTALVCNIKILSLAFTTATNAQASSYYALVHYYARPQVYITMNMFADDTS